MKASGDHKAEKSDESLPTPWKTNRHEIKIDPGSKVLELTTGRGQEEPGLWALGTYRVEILIDGVKFAESSFTVA
jgi:hypothetical protein